jgi:hypothetical protein
MSELAVHLGRTVSTDVPAAGGMYGYITLHHADGTNMVFANVDDRGLKHPWVYVLPNESLYRSNNHVNSFRTSRLSARKHLYRAGYEYEEAGEYYDFDQFHELDEGVVIGVGSRVKVTKNLVYVSFSRLGS